MKTRYWIGLIAGLMAICLAAGFFLLRPGEAATAQVYCDGRLLFALDLRVDQQRTVETEFGTNVLTVRDGRIAVTEADCPDGYCMARGYCAGGPQIVCLPNRLVISFSDDTGVDGLAG